MKKLLFIIIFFILILYSCFFPEITLEASKNGITLWFGQILPALLPFSILSGLLISSNLLHTFSGNTNLISCVLTMACGFVFGFPIGAKLSSDFYKNNLLTEKQATCLAVCTNNFSPMYVCGYALPALFQTDDFLMSTYLLIYLTPLMICVITLFHYNHTESKRNSIQACQSEFEASAEDNSFSVQKQSPNPEHHERRHSKEPSQFQLDMQIMDNSIIHGFEALIKICGYIVLFSILSKICSNLWENPPFIWNLLLGNLEISNGIQLLSALSLSDALTYVISIQLLSFGGLSGIAQTASILHTSKLSIYKYIIGKVLLSLFLTLLAVSYVSCFK